MDFRPPVCSATSVSSRLPNDVPCSTPRPVPPRLPKTPRRDDQRLQSTASGRTTSGIGAACGSRSIGESSLGAKSPASPRKQTEAPVLVPHAPRGVPARSRPNSRQGSRASSRPGSRLGSQQDSRPSSSLGSCSSSGSCIDDADDQNIGMRLPGLVLDLTEVPEDGISDEFLHKYCDGADLSSVSYLTIQVDTVVQNVDSLGACLPNLRQLRLSNSSVICIRELGTGLLNLEVLWMSRCSLQELEGIAVLQSLQELYVPFNDIADVSQLKWLESLSVLDLEGNALGSLDDVEELRRCYQLRDLSLTGNPVCKAAGFSRAAVLAVLPQLGVLDDVGRHSILHAHEVADTGGQDPDVFLDMYLETDMMLYLDCFLEQAGDDRNNMAISDDLRQLLIEGCAQASLGGDGEPGELDLVLERVKRPEARLEARGRSGHSQRTRASAAGASSGLGFSFQLPDRRQEVNTPRGSSSSGNAFSLNMSDSRDAASDLTRGGSLAGNPMAALRHRRSQAGAAYDSREADLSIRDLLKRHSC